ncbi:MAG: ATP-binding protein [Anaerovoracaceae bacterium]
MRNNTKKNIIIIVIFCLAANLIFGFVYIKGAVLDVKTISLEEKMDKFKGTMKVTEIQMDSVLKALANTFANIENPSEQEIINTMKAVQSQEGFSYIAKTSKDGYAINMEGKKGIYLKDRPYFIAGMKGESTTSLIDKGRVDNTKSFIISAEPIMKNGKADGIIHGSYSLDKYLSNAGDNSERAKETIFITTKDGRVLDPFKKDENVDKALLEEVVACKRYEENDEKGVRYCEHMEAGKKYIVRSEEIQFYNTSVRLNLVIKASDVKINVSSFLSNTAVFWILQGIVLSVLITLLLVIYRERNELDKKHKKQMARELEISNAANAAKSDFISRVSHDMRTPMNAILSFSKMGIEEEGEENLKEYLRDINTSGKYLLNLINDVLDIQKVESKGIKINLTKVNVFETIAEIIKIVKPGMDEKNIDLTLNMNFDVDKLPQYCLLDTLRFKQVFVNLISNGTKFTPENGEITVTIDLDSYKDNIANFRVTIKDNGIGMSEEFQKKMFEPFAQEYNKITSSYAGTGLGLSIVKNIIELIGGSIACESEINKGTSMVVAFPLQLVEQGESNQTNKGNIQLNYERLKGKRILLCEDHPMNIKITKKILSKQDIIIDVAENGRIGIDKFQRSESGYYDLILMDIRMPVVDGITAAKEIRNSNHPQARDIPIIAMTANTLAEDIAKTKEAGMNLHLSKPIDPKELYDTLVEQLSKNKEDIING